MANWWTRSNPETSKVESVSFDTFAELVRAAPRGRNIAEVILHHTWSPAVADYNGRSTWLGIQRYHRQERGWSDIGYHLGIGPDKTLWLLRPLQNTGAHTFGHNSRSIGVGMIGNFDAGRDDPEACLPLAIDAIAVLCERFDLGEGDVWFHRDFADKSCPGTGIDRADVRQRVAEAMGREPVTPVDPDAPSPWAADAWKWAKYHGLIKSTKPRDAVTAEWVAEVLFRYHETEF